MKKFFLFALFLCASAFADSFANTDISSSDYNADNNSVYSPKPQKQAYRNSFFMAFDIGPVFSFSTEKRDYRSISKPKDSGYGYEYVTVPITDSYSGFGLGASVKLGILIKQLLAIHAVFGVFETSGTSDVDTFDSVGVAKTFHYNDADAKHAFGGLGVTYYPFRGADDFTHGFYFGLALGLNPGGVSYENSDGVGSMSTHLQIEVGKEFDVSSRWKLGVGLTGARISHMDGDEYAEYAFQLSFHVTRK